MEHIDHIVNIAHSCALPHELPLNYHSLHVEPLKISLGFGVGVMTGICSTTEVHVVYLVYQAKGMAKAKIYEIIGAPKRGEIKDSCARKDVLS